MSPDENEMATGIETMRSFSVDDDESGAGSESQKASDAAETNGGRGGFYDRTMFEERLFGF
jgi:hypothetical protein